MSGAGNSEWNPTEYWKDENKHKQLPWEDIRGMKLSSGVAHIDKNPQNMIGVTIGGGAPYCPCLYVVQIFDGSPAAKEGTLQSGDEIVGVNNKSVKGCSKADVAKMIQSTKGPVLINYNKLHADPKQGKSLDIVLKKIKHKVVENISSSAADALGLSRAILTNDSLVKRHNELERIAEMYSGMVSHSREVMRAILSLSKVYKDFGDVFAAIGVREPLPNASQAFSQFGDAHRKMERFAVMTLRQLKPMVSDLNTFLTKVVPDTKLTIKKYLKTKFEYLSYCLKVKEMDDEEQGFSAMQEPLYRVETGNYEYRIVLRCRQEARKQFARMRADALVKIELLDNKHVQDTVIQLQKFISAVSTLYTKCYDVVKEATVFPIEVDLFEHTFNYNTTGQINDGLSDEEKEGNSRGEYCDRAVVDRGVVSAPENLPNIQAGPQSSNNGDTIVRDLLDLELGASDQPVGEARDVNGIETGVEAHENGAVGGITPEPSAPPADGGTGDVALLDLD